MSSEGQPISFPGNDRVMNGIDPLVDARIEIRIVTRAAEELVIPGSGSCIAEPSPEAIIPAPTLQNIVPIVAAEVVVAIVTAAV